MTPSSSSGLTAFAGVFAVGAQVGQTGTATVYNSDRTVAYSVTPFGADYTGGVRVALADVTGDGTPDLIAAAGPGGGSQVAVYDGAGTHAQVGTFDAYEAGYTGGVYVAAADLTGDGKAEIVTGADEGGGPRVRVFDGATVSGTAAPTALADFLAIDDANFRGGVRLSLGDISGDGVADLVVGAGFRGGPRVAVFDGASLAAGQQVRLTPDFFAFEPGLRNGVFASVGDLNGDGRGDLIFGAGPGGAPRVRALDGKAALGGRLTELANFFAGDTSSRQGVQVGTVTDDTGTATIACTDQATNAAAAFGANGKKDHDLPGGGRGTFVGGLPFDDSTFTGTGGTTTDPSTSTAATAVVGKYTGSGSGTLAVVPAAGSKGSVTTSTADVTVSLDVTSATPITQGNGRHAVRGLTLAGTMTVTVDGGSTVTLPFTGTLRLTDASTANGVSGRLRITTDRTGGTIPTGQGFTLDGKLADGKLTVGWLVAADHVAGSTSNYVFQSPASAKADKLVLTRQA
ncbi:MAG: FG-GAP-like repeat-containing protein [Gemmataceae bacterium]